MKYKDIKRILDIILALILLISLSPVLLITSIVVKLESKGPVFFKQERIGKNCKPFYIYKFRTMAADNNLLNFNEKDKVTRIGKFFRKYGIDKLPQLYNILKGEMSFIGPRPHIIKYKEYYTDEQKRRAKVLPGLLSFNTCIYEKKSILEKINLDACYVENFSFKQDLKIILDTIKNAIEIFSYREESSFGNKGNVMEELKLLEQNFEVKSNNCELKQVNVSKENFRNCSYGYKQEDKNVINMNIETNSESIEKLDNKLTKRLVLKKN